MADVSLNQSAVPLRGQCKPQPGSKKSRQLHAAKHYLTKATDYLRKLDPKSQEAVGALAAKLPLPVVPDGPGVLTFNFFRQPITDVTTEEEDEDIPLEKVGPSSEDTEPKPQVKQHQSTQPLSRKQRKALKKAAKAARKAETPKVSTKPVVKVKKHSKKVTLVERLQDTSVLDVYLENLNSGDTAKARRHLRAVFKLDQKQSIVSYDKRLAQMNEFIGNNVDRLMGDSLVIEKTAYGVASPDAYLPTPQRSDAEWDLNDGPLTDTWEGEPYRVSEMYADWEKYPAVVGEDFTYPQYIGMRKRMYTRTLPFNYVKWLELHTPIVTKAGRPMVSRFGEGGDAEDTYEAVRMVYQHNQPLFIGGLRVGYVRNLVAAYVPMHNDVDAALGWARTHSSYDCRQLCDNMYWPKIAKQAAVNDEEYDREPYQNVVPWKTEPVTTVAVPIDTVTNSTSFLRPELQRERRRERVITDLAEAERYRIRQEFVRLPNGQARVRLTTHSTDYIPVLRSTVDAEQLLTQTIPQELPSLDNESQLTGAQTYFNMYGHRPEEKKSAARLIAELMEEAYAENDRVNYGLWKSNPDNIKTWYREVSSMKFYASEMQRYEWYLRIHGEDFLNRFNGFYRWREWWMSRKAMTIQDSVGVLSGATTNQRSYRRLWPELIKKFKIKEAQDLMDATIAAAAERGRGIKISELHTKSNEIKMVAKTKYRRKYNPYLLCPDSKPAASAEKQKGKASVTSLTGNRGVADKPTVLIAPDVEKGIVKEIMEASGKNFRYAKEMNSVLKQPIVNLHKVHEIAKRFTKNEGGILVPT